ncbi:MAG: hypothetical protein A3J24_12445 [Deltaproteobacteria bacterium RIFCSPLOWO2_02_FULL_53_8]|nr:MAG: hypothetical protein A3J24_12445 [Deltaproteobacteria bacterium RIFCSPLOWO2_02_FULL_53_8]
MQGDATLYDILEVSPRACPQVIRAAYRSLAQYHHPDKQAGSIAASERQAQINHAYAVLSDPAQRQRYDQTIAVRDGFSERRGAGVQAPDHPGEGVAVQHKAARPFAFRPLD